MSCLADIFGINNNVLFVAVKGTVCVVLVPSRYNTAPDDIPGSPILPVYPRSPCEPIKPIEPVRPIGP